MARHAPHGKCIFLPSRSPPRNVDKSLKGFQTILRDDLSLSRTTYWSRNDREREWSNASNLTKLMTEFRERMARLKKKKKKRLFWLTIVRAERVRANAFAFYALYFRSSVCIHTSANVFPYLHTFSKRRFGPSSSKRVCSTKFHTKLVPFFRRRFTPLVSVTRISIYRLSIPILTNNISNSSNSLNSSSSSSIKRNNRLSLNTIRCTATKHR